MPRQKPPRSILAESLRSPGHNFALGTPNIGEKSTRGKPRRQPLNQFDDAADGSRQHHNIAAPRSLNRIGKANINRTSPFRPRKNGSRIAPNNLPAKPALLKGESKRAPNQASANNRNLPDSQSKVVKGIRAFQIAQLPNFKITKCPKRSLSPPPAQSSASHPSAPRTASDTTTAPHPT